MMLLVGGLVLGACADATVPGDDPGTRDMSDALPPPMDGAPPTTTGDMMIIEPPPPGARELRIVGDINRLIFHNAEADFTVEYVGSDADGERGISNATLTARLLDDQGQDRSATGLEGTTFVRGQRKVTDASGRATFQLRAGARDVMNAKLVIEAPDAPEVRFNVTIAREGAGGMRVRVTYDDQVGRYSYRNFSEARVDLFDRVDCDLLRDSVPALNGAYFSLPPINPFNEVDNEVSQGDLDDGLSFSVTAVLLNQAGGVVAFGCLDGVDIVGGQIVDIEIPATDLPLEFKGVFSTVNKFDLTDLLRSTENSTLNTVADVLDVLRILGSGDGDRGDAIVQLFCDLVDIGDGICDVVQAIGGRLVDRIIDEFVPPEIIRVITVISDILSIVQRMTTIGEIEFTQSGPDAMQIIMGTDNRWQKFRFTWRNGCDMGANCVREFTIGNLDEERRPIAGTFQSRLTSLVDPESGDEELTLVIEPHGLNFRYGIIILGIAEQWIIPAIVGQPGPITLEELLGNLLPCMEINDLVGDPNSGLCEDVLVAGLSEILYDQIGRLDFEPGAFRLEGTVLPLDEDGDLVIDKLANGHWTGSIAIGDSTFNFGGCFEGCRPEAGMECEPEECNIRRPE